MNVSAVRENYHTHTYRCKHASGDVADYCREAVNRGLELLGISDHTPLPDGRWSEVRMSLAQLPDYCEQISQARRDFPELRVLRGMECEFSEQYAEFYREELLERRAFDYLIGAAHFFPFRGEWQNLRAVAEPGGLRAYADYLIQAMRSGLFAFIAHPDMFGGAYPRWDREAESCSRDLLQAAAELNIPLEINGYGLRKPPLKTPWGPRPKYPWEPFWTLAEDYPISVVINSDAHRPEDVAASLDQALAIARRHHLALANLDYLKK